MTELIMQKNFPKKKPQSWKKKKTRKQLCNLKECINNKENSLLNELLAHHFLQKGREQRFPTRRNLRHSTRGVFCFPALLYLTA